MEKRIKLLLIDDDIATRTLYAESLRAVNFDVREGGDGLDGLKMVNEVLPDIIVTGIIMPRMDGFGFVEELKKSTATARIPILFLSHMGREEDRVRAEALGIKGFLVRDMTTPKDMIERINDILISKEYILGIDAFNFDAARFARDFDLHPDFVCAPEKGGGRIVLKLRKQDGHTQSFDAEITCV